MRIWLVLVLLLSVATAAMGSAFVDDQSGAQTTGQLEDLDDVDDDWALEEPAALTFSRLDVSATERSVKQWLFVSGLDRPPCARAS